MLRCHCVAAQDVVQSVREQPSPCLVTLLCLGRCGRYHEESQAPPSPKGVNPRSRRTRLSADLPGARAEKVPSTSALPLSHSVECDGSGCVRLLRTRDSCLIKRQLGWRVDLRTGDLEAASLNAGARCESTSERVVLRRASSESANGSSWLLSLQMVRLNPKWERMECLSIRTSCSS